MLLVKKVFDFREDALSSSGMMVLLLKQVHLQKEVGAEDNVKSAAVVRKFRKTHRLPAPRRER